MPEHTKGPTPGPWGWFGNARGNNIYLSTVNHGRRFVMQFNRWGMADAQPVFQVNGVMKDAKHLLKFEVGNPAVTGIEAAKTDDSVYRLDISGIDHPDAILIQHAPDLLEAAIAVLAAHESNDGQMDDLFGEDMINRLKIAVAKATGQPTD